jgi:hypothetical protein
VSTTAVPRVVRVSAPIPGSRRRTSGHPRQHRPRLPAHCCRTTPAPSKGRTTTLTWPWNSNPAAEKRAHRRRTEVFRCMTKNAEMPSSCRSRDGPSQQRYSWLFSPLQPFPAVIAAESSGNGFEMSSTGATFRRGPVPGLKQWWPPQHWECPMWSAMKRSVKPKPRCSRIGPSSRASATSSPSLPPPAAGMMLQVQSGQPQHGPVMPCNASQRRFKPQQSGRHAPPAP